MGKWTPNYVDDVLHGKVSNLVSGSIRRASVEKEPSLSYENFVHELDTGDSFTSTIIDILVKEIADRRSRTLPGDRSLISDRTSRSLRHLANAGRTYPINGRFGIPRNSANATTSASESYMIDSPDMDDDEYEMVMQDPDSLEGARTSHASNIYDAFAPSPWPPSGAARRFPASMSPPMPDWPAPHVTTAALPRPSWSGPTTQGVGANLSRQASVRRAIRTRLNDAMAERRRPYARDFVPPARPTASETPTEHIEVSTRSGATVRRFFPRSRRNETTIVSPWAEAGAGGEGSGSGESDDQGPQYVISLGNWHADYADPVRPSPDREDPAETERLLRAPRLPRSELSGLTVGNQPTLDRFFGPHATATDSQPSQNSTSAPPRNEAPGAPEEVVGYPTPGSTENENIS